MGRFTYNNQLTVDFDDRVLAHVQLAIGVKLRRGESFHLHWRDADSVGDGRTVIWIHPAAGLSYKFFGSRPIEINSRWVEQLVDSANSASGMHITPEPSPSGLTHPGH